MSVAFDLSRLVLQYGTRVLISVVLYEEPQHARCPVRMFPIASGVSSGGGIDCVSCGICVYHLGLFVFFHGVFLSSRVTGACPATADLIMRVENNNNQVILEPGIGQFREFESPRVHTRMNSWGLFLAHKLTCGKRESVS